MLIIPAIDLKDGQCVRLVKGEFNTASRVAEDPLAVSADFASSGAGMIHMVDLDGALAGVGKNREIVRAVVKNVGIPVELGGGLRDMASLDAAAGLGVYRMVIGSAAVLNPSFVEEAVKKYGERIAVGIDAKNGRVRTDGWTVDSGMDAVEFARFMEKLGVRTVIFTDIDTDGTLSGPPIEKLKLMRAAVGCSLIASGGVSNIEDVKAIKEIGADGVIIGKAYYAGMVDLEQAVRIGGAQCLQKE